MTLSRHDAHRIAAPTRDRSDHAALRAHAAACRLTRIDRRALAGHIRRADAIGTEAFAMLARLLSAKLLHAPVLKVGAPSATLAVGGAHVTYAIDDLAPVQGRLFHGEALAPGQGGVSVACLLGATLIGMSAGSTAPFLQADGTFRNLRLIRVSHGQTPTADDAAADRHPQDRTAADHLLRRQATGLPTHSAFPKGSDTIFCDPSERSDT